MNKKEIIFILTTVLGLILFVIIFVYSVYLLDKNIVCPNFGKSVNLEYKFNLLAGGCFVNYEGQWIPSKSLRGGKLN